MCLFKNRPLALAFLCFALVSVFCFDLSLLSSVVCLAILLLLSGVIWLVYLSRKRKRIFLILLCAIASLLAACSSTFLFHLPRQSLEASVGERVVLEGYVVRAVSQGEEKCAYDVRLESIDERVSFATVRIKCAYSTSLEVGERLRIAATGARFSSYDGYDEREMAFSDGVLAVYESDSQADLVKDLGNSNSLLLVFARARSFLSHHLKESIGGEEGRLAAALLLGERDALSDYTIQAFQRCGISHLLALSGLHVSILVAFLTFVLSKLRLSRRIRVIFIVLLSFSYLLLTGCAPSTVRAVLMVSVLSVAFLSRGEYDSFTSLFTALFLILLFTPYAARDLGMWMSFLAAGSIISFLPPLNEAWSTLVSKWNFSPRVKKAVSGLVLSFLVGIVANLGLLLVQVLAFGELSLLSVPATVLLSLPLSATLVLSIFCCIGLPLGFLCRFCASFMLGMANRMSTVHGALLPVDDAASLTLVIIVTLLLLALLIFEFRHVCAWLLVTVSLSMLLLPCAAVFTNVVGADVKASYLTSSSGEVIVFSQGGECTAFVLSEAVGSDVSALVNSTRADRCTEIDCLIFLS